MNNPDNHISPWSTTDVQKYLRGELPPAEMHRLEKLALDDPFLADALEGLHTHAPVDKDLAELRSRLDARVAPGKKPILLPWFRVAAAVILLVGLGFTAWYTLVDKPTVKREASVASHAARRPADTSRVAADSPRQPDRAATASAPAAVPPSLAKTAPSPLAKASPPPHRTKTSIHADTTRPIITDKTVQASTPTLPSGVLRSLKKDTVGYTANADLKTFPPAVARGVETFGQRTVTIGSKPHPFSAGNLLVFSGRVLDGYNRPLAGAALFLNGDVNKPGTVTDRQGKFNLYLPVKDTTRHLTVAMAGYLDAQYSLNTDDRTGNIIYLKENPARLDEVVISGYGSKRKEAFAAPPSDEPEALDSLWLKAMPVMGRIAYLDYLAQAKKSLAVDTTIHGAESISFLVDQKGALSEFKIERSLSAAHDAGLIHLISEGPHWKMVHGKKARVVVNLSFP
ncbi:MAG TPA: carboxypeptidase-like regulatory domain-containing protein [Puia sp.]|nr:carboxypeptidase-like regulatory domain-containing protein [Puia sp.]